jgi:hypothetical protein
MGRERVAGQPAALRAYAHTGVRLTEELAATTTALVSAAEEALAGADPRLARAPVADALAEVERVLRPLPARFDAVDAEVDRVASGLEHLDGLGLPDQLVRLLATRLEGALAVVGEVALGDPPARHAALRDFVQTATPSQVAVVLASLPDEQLEAFARAQPAVVGRLDGAPAWLRDLANRRLLAAELSRLAARIRRVERELADLPPAPGTQARRQVVRGQLDDLRRREAALGHVSRTPGVQLLVFDADRERLVLARGDVDRAQHVVTVVPGTGTSMEDAGRLLDTGATLRRGAQRAAPGTATAAVLWLDYDAPSWPLQPVSSTRAVEATEDLAGFVEGLAAVNGEATRTLVGHSYGSTVVGATARKHHLRLDAIVGLASPGMRAGEADEFQLPSGARVYAVSDTSGGKLNPLAGDPIHSVSDGLFTTRLGRDPLRSGFGAEDYDASDAGGHGLAGYIAPDSTAGGNLANVITGRYDQVR